MGKLVLLFTILLSAVDAFGQQGSVSGIVQDAVSKQRIEYATISVTDKSTSKIITGAVSDSIGAFTVKDIPFGRYSVTIEFMGYRAKTIDSVTLSASHSKEDLKTVKLEATAKSLQNVVVSGSKPIIENQIDKIVYNAANDVSSQGSAALDMLRKVPQVTVDIDGNVELQGNANIRFLINGKPSSVFGSSVTDALAAIPASQIDRIEAITTPGAKYDAQGTGGIINIILKQNKVQGYNGSMNLSTGTRNENGSLNLNMRRGDFSMNAYFSGNGQLTSETPNSQDRTSIDTVAHTTTRLLQDGYSDFDRLGYQTGIGFDWNLSKKDNVNGGISYDHYGNHSVGYINQESILRGADGTVLSDVTSFRNSDSRFLTHSVDWNLNYKRKFSQQGQELELLYNASYGLPEMSYSQSQTYTGQAAPFTGSSSTSPGTNRQTEVALNYTQPLKDDVELETGLKTVLQDINSNADVNTLNAGSAQFVADPAQSYHLRYRMNIYAGYLSASFPLFHFLNVKAGARYEYTGVNIDYPGTEVPSYDIVVPTLIVSHKLSDKQTMKIAYTRRIERTEYNELSPFVNRSDPYNLTTGNPLLKPEIGDNLELGYSRTFEKGGNLNISLIERINSQDHKRFVVFYPTYRVGDSVYQNVSVQSPQNIGIEYNSGINVSGSLPVKDKLNIRGNGMLFHRYQVTQTDLGNLDVGLRVRLNMTVSYQVTPTVLTEVFGNYYSAWRNIQGKNPQWMSYTIAVRKQFWNKKASLGLTATNPFNKYVRQVTTITTDGYTSYSEREVPAQSFGLSFNWKFGKLEFKKEEEENKEGGEQ